MEYKTHTQTGRHGWYRPAVTVAALFLLIAGATFFSGSFFKLSTLKDGEIFDASTASANSERIASIDAANVNMVVDGARIVNLSDAGFSPARLTISAGSTVAWVNNGSAARSIQVVQPVFFGSAILQPGDVFQYLFTAPGTYSYKTADRAFSGLLEVVSPNASETTTTTSTPGATGTAGGTETTTPGATGTTTPGGTGTTTPGATGTTTPGGTGTTTPGSTTTTTPGSTGTATAGSTGTTTPGSTGTTTPGATGTTTPGGTGTTTPGATGTTTGTPGTGCTPTGNVNVSIVPGGFNPSTININAATSVTWINNSGSRARIRDINHIIFDSGDIPAGGSWTYTFCNNGSYQYENSRGSGTGWVIVGTGGTITPNPSGTTTPGSTGTTTPGATGTTTPGSTGTTTPGSTGTMTPGSTTTTTPGSTGTTTPGSTTTSTPGSTGTTTPGTTSTTTPGSTGTATAGSTGTSTPGATGTITPGATTTPNACLTGFTDVPVGSTFYEFVQCLACRNILGGYPDGTFRPNNSVTRGQIAKIVSNAAGFNETPSVQTFSDVPTDHTFYLFIERAVMHDVLAGYPDGTFQPGNNATRGQIAKIVSNAAGFNEEVTTQSFADVAVGSTFYAFAERLATRNIMSGYACGGVGEPCTGGDLPYFRPANDATRGQVAKIVSNTFFPNCTP